MIKLLQDNKKKDAMHRQLVSWHSIGCRAPDKMGDDFVNKNICSNPH